MQAIAQRVTMMGGMVVDREAVRSTRKNRRDAVAAKLRAAHRAGAGIRLCGEGSRHRADRFPHPVRGVEVYLCWKLGEAKHRLLARRGRGLRRAQSHRPGFPRSSPRRPPPTEPAWPTDNRKSKSSWRLTDPPAHARRRLRAAGFRVSRRRVFESNAVFDTPDLTLRAASSLLRLRQAGTKSSFTFKGPPVPPSTRTGRNWKSKFRTPG